VVHDVTQSPRDAIVGAWAHRHFGSAAARNMAEEAIAALAAAGYSVVPTAEYEDLDEIRASATGCFPRCVLIKPDRDRDLYIGWSNVVEGPVGMWTRAEALAEGCAPSRLRRVDETGTSQRRDPMSSYDGVLDGAWDDKGFVAEQRGWLPRARLAAYAIALFEDRNDDAWDLLEPFDDATEVRRG